MDIDNQSWLALTVEEPVDPALPICDPHHHLYDRTNRLHPGINYLVEEYLGDIGTGHNVTKTVFVQAGEMYKKDAPGEMQPVGETETVERITAPTQAGKTRVAAGIVGFADLTLGAEVAPVLEAHIKAGKERFRGIRYAPAWDASNEIVSYRKTPGILSDKNFLAGFACLQRYGLSYDAWLYHPQMAELADLANAFPEVPIILNHTGGPLRIGPYAKKREAAFGEWQQGIARLAACPNVFIKLGALGMRMFGFGWHERAKPPGSEELAGAMAPYYLWCIEKLGTCRCMFESNFPADRLSYSYTVLWNTFKRIVKDFSASEKSALFYGTAVKAYRLAK
ncbi:MAG: amidohydrolase [Dehalococcoidia bacterium]|nr:MAG: amidohydrolase [Dehalococcoidia bacterium]